MRHEHLLVFLKQMLFFLHIPHFLPIQRTPISDFHFCIDFKLIKLKTLKGLGPSGKDNG